MKLYLLSSPGERHEDRIPVGIFSSIDNIKNYLTYNNPDGIWETPPLFKEFKVKTDYGMGIQLYLLDISNNEYNSLSKEEQDSIEFEEYYIIEEWSLNNENIVEDKTENCLPFQNKIENFNDLIVRDSFKQKILLILKRVELNSRGLGSTEINQILKKGNESQMRSLIHELENEQLIYSTGNCSQRKWIAFELKDQADKIYLDQINLQKKK